MKARRLTVLHGQHLIHGFVFDLQVLGEQTARQRILQHWEDGARVYRFPSVLVLLLATPRWQSCALAPGAPLRKVQGAYSTAQLPPTLLATLALPPGAVVVVQAGHLHVHACSTAQEEDLTLWLDLSAYQRLDLTPLGPLPAPPVMQHPAGLVATHTLLQDPTLAPAAALSAMLADLRQESPPKPRLRLLAGLLSAVPRLLGRLTGWGRSAPASTTASRATTPVPHRDTWRQRLQQRAAGWLLRSQLGQLVGRRHARYFRAMMRMFEAGDLEQALRHAIPLHTLQDALPRLMMPRFGLPTPRTALNITQQRPGVIGAYGLDEEFFGYLQQLYRRAFEQLDRQGQIQQAAFVLAELLQATEEAVSYLERHGELHAAATLAEGREARPALVVRQWWLAGETDRAMAVAKRTGAFAEAVSLLEPQHPEAAHKMRLLWSTILAEAGDYAAAVDVLWPVPDARVLATHWLDAAVEQGGAAGARQLARQLTAVPEAFTTVRERVLTLLRAPEREYLLPRRAFTRALLAEARTPHSAVMARAALRTMVRDTGSDALVWSREDLQRMRILADDAALATDLPTFQATGRRPPAMPLAQRSPPLQWCATDRGTVPIWDVAALPNRRFALALGEAGVRIVTAAGKTWRSFPVPAHHLVVADSGNRLIALARRGEALRLSKLALAPRHQRPYEAWQDTRLSCWATDYDGTTWWVAVGKRLLALDTQAAEITTLWQMNDLPGPVWAMQRSADALALLIATAAGFECWRYEIPGPVLRQREPVTRRDSDEGDIEAAAVRADGLLGLILRRQDPDSQRGELWWSGTAPGVALGLTGQARSLLLTPDWCILPTRQDDGVTVYLWRYADTCPGPLRAELRFPGSTYVALRYQAPTLTLADPLGRLVSLDLTDGAFLVQMTL